MRKYLISILLFLCMGSKPPDATHAGTPPVYVPYTKHTILSGSYPQFSGVNFPIYMTFTLHMPAANPNGRLPALIFFWHGRDHRGPLPTGLSDFGTVDIIGGKGIQQQIMTADLPLMTIPGGISPQDDIGFAVLSMQCYQGFDTWPQAYVNEEILWALNNLQGQVDFSRFYGVGYSQGGGCAIGAAGNTYANPKLAHLDIEAGGYTGSTNYQYIADSNLGITVYATVNDPLAPIAVSDNWVKNVNAANPLSPVQYIRFTDLPTTLGGSTQHDRIWPVVNNLTPGTSYTLTNGDTWLQTTMLKRALSFTNKRYHR